MKIERSKYKNLKAFSIDIGNVVFKVIPEAGMKIASAIHKDSGFEFMHQNPKGLKKYKVAGYNSSFADDGECAGFDDMMPTIDPFWYEENTPWEGIYLPNHGEIWCQPYSVKKGADYLYGKVNGIRLPYIFTKKFYALSEDVLRIEYTCENPTQYPMEYLWAGHVMLNAEEGSKYIVPLECNEGICMFSNNDRIGKYGDRFSFPINKAENGVTYDMTVMRSPSVASSEKYYLANKLTQDGYLGIEYPSKNLSLVLRFPIDEIPYIGIMNNECGWDGMYQCILEPCTAPYDRPDIAKLHKVNSVLQPNSVKKWYVDIEITKK